jgi:hypothetical protein
MKKRGITLLELMIWSVLALIVSTMVAQLLRPVLEFSRVEAEKSDAYLDATLVMTRLLADLNDANSSGLSFHNPNMTAPNVPDASQLSTLCIQPQESASQSQQPVFKEQLILYRAVSGQKGLKRAVIRPPVLALTRLTPLRPSLQESEAAFLNPANETRSLSQNVSKFLVENQDSSLAEGQIGSVLAITLHVSNPRGTYEFKQSRKYSVRTSL